MELRGVRPRIDDLDLVGVDALLHEALLDRFADRDDGRDASGRVAETVERIEPEADAAVQDQDREPHEQARNHRERAGLALLRVHDLDAVTPDQARQARRGPEIDLRSHRNRVVPHAGGAHLGRPDLARARRDGDVVAVRRESGHQVTELDRGPGEVILLGVELEDPERVVAQPAKNSRTRRATSSISASVWPADIGSVRISSTTRSVTGSGGGARCSIAGCRCPGTG